LLIKYFLHTYQMLQDDLQKRASMIMDLKQQVHAYSSDVARTHMMTRQQEKNEKLEVQISEMETSEKQTRSDLNQSMNAQAVMKDQIASYKNQIKNLRASYDKDIGKIRPLLEEQVSKTHDDLRDMQVLRNETTLNASRLAMMDKQLLVSQQLIFKAQNDQRSAETELLLRQDRVEALEEEIAKERRLKLVVVAAKMQFQANAQSLEQQVLATEQELLSLGNQNDEFFLKSRTLELQVPELEEEIIECNIKMDGMKKQMQKWRAEAASAEMQSSKLRDDFAEIKSSETEDKLKLFSAMKIDLKMANESNVSLKKQLATSLQRVYELQGQLLDTPEPTIKEEE